MPSFIINSICQKELNGTEYNFSSELEWSAISWNLKEFNVYNSQNRDCKCHIWIILNDRSFKI